MNEIKKAIKAMKQLFKYNVYGIDNSDARLAIEALEKQIPKKPSVTINPTDIKIGSLTWKAGAKVHYCPICNNPISCDKYCRICGQRLDWSVEE